MSDDVKMSTGNQSSRKQAWFDGAQSLAAEAYLDRRCSV